MLRYTAAALLVLLAAGGCASSTKDPDVASAASAGAPRSSPSAASDAVTEYIEKTRSYVKCMRAAGYDYTDPDPQGHFEMRGGSNINPKNDPKWIAASKTCGPLPPQPRELQPRRTPEELKAQQQYAKCMQTHGAPDFPDPDPDGYEDSKDWNQDTDAARRALRECLPIVGEPATPVPAQG